MRSLNAEASRPANQGAPLNNSLGNNDISQTLIAPKEETNNHATLARHHPAFDHSQPVEDFLILLKRRSTPRSY